MAVHQVCFVHVLANLTQKALIGLPTLTFKVSVTILQIRKVQVICDSNHMPSMTLNEKKNPQRRKALWKLKKKKGAATTVGDKAKQYRQSRWIIYNNICEAVHTWKKTLKIILHPNVWWVICQKQNNLGLNTHLEHNAWTVSTWVTHSWVWWAEFPSTTFTRQTTKW